MNKLFTSIAAISLGLTMAIGVGAAVGASTSGKNAIEAKADVGSLVYTLDGTITATGSAYATATNLTQDSISWSVVANTEQNPWRIGGKSITAVDRAIYSTTALTDNIAKIEVSSGATASSLTVNSLTISVHGSSADASSGSNAVATKTVTSGIASSTVEFVKSDSTSWAGKYFRIVYNVTRTSSSGNGYISFNFAKFYKEAESSKTVTGLEVLDENANELSDGDEINLVGNGATATADLVCSVSYSDSSSDGLVDISSSPSAGFASSTLDDETYTLTFTANGDFDVTIAAHEDNSVAITVTYHVSGITEVLYERITSESRLKAGLEFLIANTDGSYVMAPYASGNSSPYVSSSLNAQGKMPEANIGTGYAVLTLGGNSGAWTITDQNNNIYYGTSGQNYLKASSSATDTWSITIDSTNFEATITSSASSRWIAQNTSTKAFATYANANQWEVALYALPSTDPAITVEVTGETTLGVGETATLTATKIHGATGIVGWATSDSSVLSISAATGDSITVTGVSAGPATITASLTGCDDVDTSFTVRNGTSSSPYSVSEARDAIDAGTGLTDAYTSGIISHVDSYNSTYHSITYWISDDGLTTSDQLEVYGGLGLNQAEFSSIDDLQVGDEVTVVGTLQKYSSTYEYASNNYLTAFNRPVVDITSITGVEGILSAQSGDLAWDTSSLKAKGTISGSASVVDITLYVTITTSDVPGTVSETTTRKVTVTVTPKDSGSAVLPANFQVDGTINLYTGPLTDGGRYYIMNSDKTYGLSAEAASTTPNAVSLASSNSLTAFDVKITAQNSYEFTTTISDTKYYLVCNTNATSSSNSMIRITSSPLSSLASKSWVLDNTDVDTTGAYHMSENTIDSTHRYLSYYTDSATKWDWRGYTAYKNAQDVKNGDPEIQFVAEKTYAESIADMILDACSSGGSTPVDENEWGDIATAYNAITISAEKNFLINGTADKTSADKIERALEKYDWAVKRYGDSYAFITGRSSQGLIFSDKVFTTSSENIIPIIVIISLISVSAIGGYFYIRRRKEQ